MFNMGSADRIIRAVVGIALIALGFIVLQGALGIVLGVVGVILGATALTGVCPLYMPFNFSTKRAD
ncbi:MAG: DUF2892 domain-containing protein [Chloroflexi bacterium]|nr:DUF2892 domain-containing protein [Chloroflexota bacterium]